MTLKEKAAAYAASIRSDRYAIGRTSGQKMIDGIMAGIAYEAGYRAALADVQTFIDMHLKEYPNTWIMVAHAIEELGK